jgi:hypothetical protein
MSTENKNSEQNSKQQIKGKKISVYIREPVDVKVNGKKQHFEKGSKDLTSNPNIAKILVESGYADYLE